MTGLDSHTVGKIGTEIALFRTSAGGMSRMAVSWDIPTHGGERGRVYGQRNKDVGVPTQRPPLPPAVAGGAHGGSHGHLTSEFIDAILRDRKPWIDVALSLNMTVAGMLCLQCGQTGSSGRGRPTFTAP